MADSVDPDQTAPVLSEQVLESTLFEKIARCPNIREYAISVQKGFLNIFYLSTYFLFDYFFISLFFFIFGKNLGKQVFLPDK